MRTLIIGSRFDGEYTEKWYPESRIRSDAKHPECDTQVIEAYYELHELTGGIPVYVHPTLGIAGAMQRLVENYKP